MGRGSWWVWKKCPYIYCPNIPARSQWFWALRNRTHTRRQNAVWFGAIPLLLRGNCCILPGASLKDCNIQDVLQCGRFALQALVLLRRLCKTLRLYDTLCVCVCSGFGCRDSFSCTAGILKNFPKVHCNAPCTDICCDLIPNSTCLTRPLGVLERILYAPAACRIAAQKAKRLGWGFCGVVFLAGVVVLLEVVFFFSLAVWPLSFSILVLTSKELPPDFQPHTRTVNVS